MLSRQKEQIHSESNRQVEECEEEIRRLKERKKELEDRVVEVEKRVVDVEAELMREKKMSILKESQLQVIQSNVVKEKEEERELMMKEVKE